MLHLFIHLFQVSVLKLVLYSPYRRWSARVHWGPSDVNLVFRGSARGSARTSMFPPICCATMLQGNQLRMHRKTKMDAGFEKRLCEEVRRYARLCDASLQQCKDNQTCNNSLQRETVQTSGKEESVCRQEWKYLRDRGHALNASSEQTRKYYNNNSCLSVCASTREYDRSLGLLSF